MRYISLCSFIVSLFLFSSAPEIPERGREFDRGIQDLGGDDNADADDKAQPFRIAEPDHDPADHGAETQKQLDSDGMILQRKAESAECVFEFFDHFLSPRILCCSPNISFSCSSVW